MKEWQFNVLFFVGVGGAVFLLVAPVVPGLQEIPKSPGSVTGIGVILAYVLQQKRHIVKKPKTEDDGEPPGPSEGAN